MISIREIDYDTDDDPEKLFSRLTWAVERVDGLAEELMNSRTVDTDRPWVGVYDEVKMSFGLIEPRGFFSMKFFHIVVRGQIKRSENKTAVNIKLRLGFYTFLIFLMVYLITPLMISEVVMPNDPNRIEGTVVWLLAYPVLGTILLNWKLNRIESKVEELFGFH